MNRHHQWSIMVIEGSVVSTTSTIFMRCRSLNGHSKGVKFVCTDPGKGWTAACGAELGKADITVLAQVASAFLSKRPLRLAHKPVKRATIHEDRP